MLSKTSTALALILALTCFSMPSVATASTLSSSQVQAIVGLLQAFNVDQAVVAQVQQILTGTLSSITTASVTSSTSTALHIQPIGSVYPSSNVGFDVSYATPYYPSDRFSFGIVGVSGGKAFVHNSRFASQYPWARFGTIAPTIYMNLNAPYGSTVAGNSTTPKSCPARSVPSEPTACEGYNYGYNAGKDAYLYAKGNSAISPLWWLDIEEANSWSPDTAVNDQVIQGAIDYLNTQGLRVGIYSMAYMWRDIAGSSFTPTQTINGNAVSIPTWMPIGIDTLTGALNACATYVSFVPTSPIWIIQYVADAVSVDQNVSC